jgi:hypothetical protein
MTEASGVYVARTLDRSTNVYVRQLNLESTSVRLNAGKVVSALRPAEAVEPMTTTTDADVGGQKNDTT